MELLLCLGQGLWERLSDGEFRAYWALLGDEIGMGIEGEIDEQALEEKRSLAGSRSRANTVKRLERYGRASFAGTVAEYVHSLWHEVTVRTGPEYLPVSPVAATPGANGAVVPAGPRLSPVPRVLRRAGPPLPRAC